MRIQPPRSCYHAPRCTANLQSSCFGPSGIAREKERIERIQQEKQARKAKAQQRRARLSTAGRPDTAAGDDTSLNSLGMANAGDEAEVEPEGSKARTSRNTPPRSLFLLCCLWCCIDVIYVQTG